MVMDKIKKSGSVSVTTYCDLFYVLFFFFFFCIMSNFGNSFSLNTLSLTLILCSLLLQHNVQL